MTLKPPPRNLRESNLATVSVPAADLFRVSKFSFGEPYFGRAKANRFDDPTRTKKRRFGTCYCGLDLETAIAETLLHDEMPVRGTFKLSFTHFESHQLVGFSGYVCSGARCVEYLLTGVAVVGLPRHDGCEVRARGPTGATGGGSHEHEAVMLRSRADDGGFGQCK
jgi:hypothetical protein